MNSEIASLPGENLFKNRRSTRRWFVHAGAVLSVLVVCIALSALYRTAQRIHSNEVWEGFSNVSPSALVLALVCTIASYIVVIGYDIVALHHLERPLPAWRAALAAFLAAAFGNNIGFSMVTGASIRYRIYSIAGLSALEIAGISTMCTITTALGMLFILAAALLFDSSTVTASAAHLSPLARYAIGSVIMVVLIGYILFSSVRPLVIRTANWTLRLPTAGTALAQVALGTTDMVLVGTLIYVLLPDGIVVGYLSFLGVFVLAMLAGGMSHVPGGIGVFETILLLGLPEIPPATLLGSILVFRGVYFILPLALGALLFAIYEVLLQRARFTKLQALVTDWLAEVGPQVMAALVIIAGMVLLFSSALPIAAYRQPYVNAHFPLWSVEIAHAVATASGLILVLLASGLSRRLASAHRWTLITLAIGLVASYIKDLGGAEALLLAPLWLIMWPTKPEFRRDAPLLGQAYSVEWLSTLSAILAITVWLGFFNFKHVAYRHDLWLQFSYTSDVSRFLRSLAVTVALAAGVGLRNVFRRRTEPTLPDAATLEHIARLVARESDTRANLALLGDKRLLFSPSGASFIMYQVKGKSWVALGDPVGRPEERTALLWQFRELCDHNGGWPVFYLVDAANLSAYVDLGLSLIKLGDEARVPLEHTFIQSVGNVDIRKIHRRVSAEGVSFEMVPQYAVATLLPELTLVSTSWLALNDGKAFGFSRGHFNSDYVCRFPCAIARHNNHIIAFAVVWTGYDKQEIALDLLRYHPYAPEGILDYLLVELMLHSKNEGYRWFNLGIAPLTNIENNPMAPVWHRVGKLIYRQSEHFKNIESLRRFEENFRPQWRPKYLASPGGFNAPRILRDIARLTTHTA